MFKRIFTVYKIDPYGYLLYGETFHNGNTYYTCPKGHIYTKRGDLFIEEANTIGMKGFEKYILSDPLYKVIFHLSELWT